MTKKRIIFPILITSLIISFLAFPQTYSDPTPKVYIQKSPGFLQPQQIITINVTIANVTNLNFWQIKLSYDPRILDCFRVLIPTNNIFAGYPISNDSQINNNDGLVTAFCAIQGLEGVSGSGTLCQIRFTCLAYGASNLHFVNPNLLSGCYLQDPNYVLISFEAIDKMIEVVPLNSQTFYFTHTQGSKTYYINVITNLTATTFNHNYATKETTFNLTGTKYTIGFCLVEIPKALLNHTLLVFLNDSPYRMLSQSFNTLPENATYCFPSFTYNQTRNSMRIKMRFTVPGDITGDRINDITDVALAAFGYGANPGHPRWYDAADINFDSLIDITDVASIAFYYGQTMP